MVYLTYAGDHLMSMTTIHRDTEEDVLKAIGALVVNFGAMEESLHDGIMLLAEIKSPKVVNVLTAGLPFRSLVEKLGALCTELNSARVPIEEVKRYCTYLLALNDRRNTVIHSSWNWLGSSGTRRFKRVAKTGSGFSLNVEKMSAAEISALAKGFREAEKKLWEIIP